jgi:hypothetical protein
MVGEALLVGGTRVWVAHVVGVGHTRLVGHTWLWGTRGLVGHNRGQIRRRQGLTIATHSPVTTNTVNIDSPTRHPSSPPLVMTHTLQYPHLSLPTRASTPTCHNPHAPVPPRSQRGVVATCVLGGQLPKLSCAQGYGRVTMATNAQLAKSGNP